MEYKIEGQPLPVVICQLNAGESMVSYGLGWDAVQFASFEQNGIQCLVKGGDTLRYHAALLVLPEYHMLELAAVGFAPANCVLSVRQSGPSIVCDAHGDALAEVIAALEERYL